MRRVPCSFLNCLAKLNYSVQWVLCFLTVNVAKFNSMCCVFIISVQRWCVVLVDVKQYNSVSLQCYVFITGEFSLQRCYVVSVDGSTVHSSCQSTVFCVLIVRVWLNSAACVVCMSCRQVRVTIVRVWLNSAMCVVCVCGVSKSR